MIELVLTEADAHTLRSELTSAEVESCAILLATQTSRSDGSKRLLVREIEFPSSDSYSRRGLLEAELKPEVVARATKRARREGLAIIFAHSHPGVASPVFSEVDARGEELLSRFLAHRHPDLVHMALVISQGGFRARRLGSTEEVRIVAVGLRREVLYDPSQPISVNELFDRQIRAFGSEGQAALQRLRIAVVGLGGTGSIIAQELVHLGVRDLILIDPDTIELTNLNRVANAGSQDIGRLKVEIAARYIRSVDTNVAVAEIAGDIIRSRFARLLCDADIIFGCTDSHGSRAVLQQVAYQYLIPCIDMGSTIAVTDDRITHIYGRVQLLSPGMACFTCGGLLDGNEVRRDMMTAFERQADPYLRGAREPAPSVMSLNATVASLAVTMLLGFAVGVPSDSRHMLYNAIASTLRSVKVPQDPNCFICSQSGALARGDAWPLMARQD